MKPALSALLSAPFFFLPPAPCTAAPPAAPSPAPAAQPAAPPLSAADAKAQASKWLEGLPPKGLVLDKTFPTEGFTVTHGQGALGPLTKFTLNQPGWQIALAFHGHLEATAPLKTLREKFWYFAADRLPTPGLALTGWETWPQTPRSSIETGVEILGVHDGRIRIRVQTALFALYGRDPSAAAPADGPSPPDSFFQIRKEFPLDLTVDAPFAAQKK